MKRVRVNSQSSTDDEKDISSTRATVGSAYAVPRAVAALVADPSRRRNTQFALEVSRMLADPQEELDFTVNKVLRLPLLTHGECPLIPFQLQRTKSRGRPSRTAPASERDLLCGKLVHLQNLLYSSVAKYNYARGQGPSEIVHKYYGNDDVEFHSRAENVEVPPLAVLESAITDFLSAWQRYSSTTLVPMAASQERMLGELVAYLTELLNFIEEHRHQGHAFSSGTYGGMRNMRRLSTLALRVAKTSFVPFRSKRSRSIL